MYMIKKENIYFLLLTKSQPTNYTQAAAAAHHLLHFVNGFILF